MTRKSKEYEPEILLQECTPEFYGTAELLHSFIDSLALDKPDRKYLREFISNHVRVAEYGAFAQGFRIGKDFGEAQQLESKYQN